jgi:hypothetical protein
MGFLLSERQIRQNPAYSRAVARRNAERHGRAQPGRVRFVNESKRDGREREALGQGNQRFGVRSVKDDGVRVGRKDVGKPGGFTSGVRDLCQLRPRRQILANNDVVVGR